MVMIMEIYLVRHGYSQSNAGDNSSDDPALAPLGLTQANCLAERFDTVLLTGIIVSPLRRTVQTALPTAKEKGLPLLLCHELLEVDTPETWVCKPLGYMCKEFDYDNISLLSDGYSPRKEDAAARRDRADKVMNLIRENFQDDDKVLLVTHGTFLRQLMMAVLDMPRDFDMRFTMTNACVNRVIWSKNEPPRLALMNDTRHLPLDCISPCGKADIFG